MILSAPLDRRVRAVSLCAWALGFALVMTIGRAVITGSTELAGLALGGLGQALTGLLVAWLVLGSPRWRVVAGWLLSAFLVVGNLAAFHYEEIFGRLPGAAMAYYLREATHLASSVGGGGNVSLTQLLAESGLLLALLGGLTFFWRRRLHVVFSAKLRVAAASVLAVVVCVPIVLHAAPGLFGERVFWKSRVPVIWFLQTAVFSARPPDERGAPGEEDIAYFRSAIGLPPAPIVDTHYPLCGAVPAAGNDTPATARSAILVVLESVGNPEMDAMPNLKRIAAENVTFTNYVASGTKSVQAFPSLFAGIPPQPAANLLWRQPLPAAQGWPAVLAGRGYHTMFLHGGDLSFEQQRPFLKRVGFDDIYELGDSPDTPVVGWGYADGHMFDVLRTRVAASERPFLATLFTLTTHDPYILPSDAQALKFRDDWDREMGDDGKAFAATLQYLDAELGELYAWYEQEEKPKGTLLVFVGDHAPHLAKRSRFHVPLIVAGVPPPASRGITSRLGTHHDLPATVLAALGVATPRCHAGLDLLAPSFPDDRLLYTVGGDNLELVSLFGPFGVARVHRLRRLFDGPPGSQEETTRFLRVLLPLSRYLVAENAFAPAETSSPVHPLPPVPRVDAPALASHRGHTAGLLPTDQQNKPKAFRAALAAGFEWLELDVQVTRDGVAVVVHDPSAPDARGKAKWISQLTLAELRELPGLSDVVTLEEAVKTLGPKARLVIDVKPQGHIARMMAVSREVSRIASGTHGVAVTLSPDLALSLRHHCECAVGLELQPGLPVRDDWLVAARDLGMTWVALEIDSVTPAVIGRAHTLGLRVMVYTVNEKARIDALSPELPDLVITDNKRIWDE